MDLDILPQHGDFLGLRGSSWLPLTTFGVITAAAAYSGRGAYEGPWYWSLRKPSFQPPDIAFPIVWTALYGTIAVSGFRVWRSLPSPARSRALCAWGLQLGLNAAYSAIFVRQHRLKAALADNVALLGAIAAYAWQAKRVDKTAAKLMLPYAAWSLFACVLTGALVAKNA